MEWISIKKELPKEDKTYWVKMTNGNSEDVVIADWSESEFQIVYGQFYVAQQAEGFKEYNISMQAYTGYVITDWKDWKRGENP